MICSQELLFCIGIGAVSRFVPENEQGRSDINIVSSTHVETVVLLSRENVDGYINMTLDVGKLGAIPHSEPVEGVSGQSERIVQRTYGVATYREIKAYIAAKHGLKMPSLYIGQVKDKLGIKTRKNYYIGSGKRQAPICPPEKEAAILDAFHHFGMIPEE